MLNAINFAVEIFDQPVDNTRRFYAARAGHIHTVMSIWDHEIVYYKVKSSLVLNMSHIKWGTFSTVFPATLLGTCPPSLPVSAPMLVM